MKLLPKFSPNSWKMGLETSRPYGYRDLELMTLRILSLHATRFELIG